MKNYLPLLALTLATFCIGSAEFVIQGLLPEVSADLGVSIPMAGLLITGYALGVAIGGPFVAILTLRWPRKTALLGLMGVFIVGDVLCALAPNYALLMAGRVVASFCHGSFVGISAVVAAAVAPQHRRASAVAIVWAGFAAANVLGVPAGAALGQVFGWRTPFWAIAALGVAALAAIALALPEVGRGGATRLSSELKALGRLPVVLALSLSVAFSASAFSVFTYIAPLLLEITGISPAALPFYLLTFGLGGVIGMQVGGRAGDWNLMGSLIGDFAANVVVYLILLAAFRSPAPALVMMFIWGFGVFFAAPPIQVRLVNAAAEAPNLASTVLQSGFNLGNAIGPFLGAAVLNAGFSYAFLPWLGAVVASIGVAIGLWSKALDRRAVGV